MEKSIENYLINNYRSLSKKELAKNLNLTYNQVDNLLRKLNLRRYESKKYTESEIAFIKENYPIKGSKYCAEQLGRSENAINKKIKKLGLSINWNHIYITDYGYYMNCSDRKHRYLVHRHVMEEHLGRKLRSDEIVHHIDGNKLNNDICNLTIMTRSEHARLHMKKCK